MERNTNKKKMWCAVVMGLAAALLVAGSAVAAKQAPAQPLNINTASVSELATIPGIGKTKAQAIVDYRAMRPFANVEELKDVKGIGDKLLAKITPYVTVAQGAKTAESGTAGKVIR